MTDQKKIEEIRRRLQNAFPVSVSEADYLEALADCETLLTALDERDREIERLARYIANHNLTTQDHACYRCSSDSELLVEGFVCGRHLAQDILLTALADHKEE